LRPRRPECFPAASPRKGWLHWSLTPLHGRTVATMLKSLV